MAFGIIKLLTIPLKEVIILIFLSNSRGSSVVERKPEELGVVGSIPTPGTIFSTFLVFPLPLFLHLKVKTILLGAWKMKIFLIGLLFLSFSLVGMIKDENPPATLTDVPKGTIGLSLSAPPQVATSPRLKCALERVKSQDAIDQNIDQEILIKVKMIQAKKKQEAVSPRRHTSP